MSETRKFKERFIWLPVSEISVQGQLILRQIHHERETWQNEAAYFMEAGNRPQEKITNKIIPSKDMSASSNWAHLPTAHAAMNTSKLIHR